jgi:2,4-diaminopentanoate dehydrogenase
MRFTQKPRYKTETAYGNDLSCHAEQGQFQMPEHRRRVIQWATGSVGKAALRHFIDNPAFDLAGVLVYDSAKVGKDAGAIAGSRETGVIATDDVDAIVALDADCVFYTPIWPDIEMICRLLRTGKNVVTTGGLYYPTDFTRADLDRIENACTEGGASFHAGGIHPGFAGDLLPLTLARLASRIDQIQVYEIVDFSEYPSKYLQLMGFGSDPLEFNSAPSLLGASVPFFAQSMAMIVDGLAAGVIDDITSDVEIATATTDITYSGRPDSDFPDLNGVVRAGTVAAQHHTWTAWVNGTPLVVFHAMYTMGDDVIEPRWDWGDTRYRVVIAGDPPTELTLQGTPDATGNVNHPGYTWTAMAAVNSIHAVCAAAPGLITHLDLGALRLPGLTPTITPAGTR